MRKTRVKPTKLVRYFPDDIEHIVLGYGSRARVIQLWRLADGTYGRWIYLARITPYQCTIEYIAHRFGGGDYRAKILGEWDPERRCEQYFERVSFAIDDFYKPTAETLARTRSALQK
jgi:hypothetical protein